MGRKGQNSTLEQRKIVLQLHLEGKTYREIGDIVKMKPNTVGDIVRRFRNEGRIASIKQKGQPKKLTEREDAQIVRKIKTNPRRSAPELTAELFAEHGKTVSAQTIRRIIKKQGYNGRVARKSLCCVSATGKKGWNLPKITQKRIIAGGMMSFS